MWLGNFFVPQRSPFNMRLWIPIAHWLPPNHWIVKPCQVETPFFTRKKKTHPPVLKCLKSRYSSHVSRARLFRCGESSHQSGWTGFKLKILSVNGIPSGKHTKNYEHISTIFHGKTHYFDWAIFNHSRPRCTDVLFFLVSTPM